jgi:uncharacterized membrane-anchored protein
MRSWRGFLLLALLGFLFFYNFSIIQKERLLSQGERIILELAPVDPRSLMQGDYMLLDFAVARPLLHALEQSDALPRNSRHAPRRILGRMVLRPENGAHVFARLDDGRPLAREEKLLRFKIEGWNNVKIGGGSFFFEEGLAKLYEHAGFALLRVDGNGEAIITGLLDTDKEILHKGRWNFKTGRLRKD